jgi:hypothetical protein
LSLQEPAKYPQFEPAKREKSDGNPPPERRQSAHQGRPARRRQRPLPGGPRERHHVEGDETKAAYRRRTALKKRVELMKDWENYCYSEFKKAPVARLIAAA